MWTTGTKVSGKFEEKKKKTINETFGKREININIFAFLIGP